MLTCLPKGAEQNHLKRGNGREYPAHEGYTGHAGRDQQAGEREPSPPDEAGCKESENPRLRRRIRRWKEEEVADLSNLEDEPGQPAAFHEGVSTDSTPAMREHQGTKCPKLFRAVPTFANISYMVGLLCLSHNCVIWYEQRWVPSYFFWYVSFES